MIWMALTGLEVSGTIYVRVVIIIRKRIPSPASLSGKTMVNQKVNINLGLN